MTTDPAAAVRAREQEWIDVYLRADADAFAALLADDFVYTSERGVFDKAAYVSNLRTGEIEQERRHVVPLAPGERGRQVQDAHGVIPHELPPGDGCPRTSARSGSQRRSSGWGGVSVARGGGYRPVCLSGLAPCPCGEVARPGGPPR